MVNYKNDLNKIYDTNLKSIKMFIRDFQLDETITYKKNPEKYTRNLICKEGNKYALILICWAPNSISPIHDHESECCFKIISGSLHEYTYEINNNKLIKSSESIYNNGEIGHINDDKGVHSMENLSDDYSLSLHLYIPANLEATVYLDINNAKKNKKSKMTFDI
jgi:cysteine dioxygenase